LNHAAFGRPYDQVLQLSLALRAESEIRADVFYDQVLHSLINGYTYPALTDFFGTENVVLVPNCTFGMKAVVEKLRKDGVRSGIVECWIVLQLLITMHFSLSYVENSNLNFTSLMTYQM
jgi:hypothetical protein